MAFPAAMTGAARAAAVVLLASAVALARAAAAAEFDEADIFFELNATDRDVGVHVSLDAESWRELRIEGPGGQRIIEVSPRGKLGRIGLTELFVEGEEPSLDAVPFARFLALVPPGSYAFLGRTVDGEPLRSTDPLTAELPCPVALVSPPEGGGAVAAGAAVVRWTPAPGLFDPDRGRCNPGDVGLVGYQVIVDVENERTGASGSFSADLPPGATSVTVPAAFLEGNAGSPGTAFKVEVLAIEDSGNKTITERGFRVR